jgi:hypothetical protein
MVGSLIILGAFILFISKLVYDVQMFKRENPEGLKEISELTDEVKIEG